jgi:tetratricopeptide (TPR) repeat protein
MNKSFWIKYFLVFFTLTAPARSGVEAQVHSADYYYERANWKVYQGNLGEAIEDLNTVIKLNPNNSRNYNSRGIVYEKIGDYKAAMADFEQALLLNPYSAEAQHNIRNLSNKIKNSEKYSSGINYAFDAVTQFENSDEIPVKNQTPMYTVERSSSNQVEISRAHQEAALPKQEASLPNQTNFNNTHPSHVSIIDNVQTPAYSTPAKVPENAAVRTASSTNNYLSRTNAYPPVWYAAHGTDYIDVKSDSIAYTPIKPVGYTAAKHKKSPEPPIKKIFIDPAAEKYNMLGVEFNAKGHFDEAIEQFNEAINVYPNYAAAYNNRGAAFAGKGDPERALEDFNQALRINPYYRDAQFNRERVMNGKSG